MRNFAPLLLTLLFLAPEAADAAIGTSEASTEKEPIPYLERYQPSFFLLGKPPTKVQISFKVQAIRSVPLYVGYTQLMMWELFKDSAPFRDLNYSPELFFRSTTNDHTYLDFGAQHESNGLAGPDSRSWNRAYVRFFQTRSSTGGSPDRRAWWTVKAWVPFAMDRENKHTPEYRGAWEVQLSLSDLFGSLFEVNEVTLRLYPGGKSWTNPLKGGQELTYREKTTRRTFLLPLYLQIFHGYGENLLDASVSHWGVRAGIGF